MRSIAFLTQKGGAGKTTLAASLAATAACTGERVIVLDLDPLQSLVRWAKRRNQQSLRTRLSSSRSNAIGCRVCGRSSKDSPGLGSRWRFSIHPAPTPQRFASSPRSRTSAYCRRVRHAWMWRRQQQLSAPYFWPSAKPRSCLTSAHRATTARGRAKRQNA